MNYLESEANLREAFVNQPTMTSFADLINYRAEYWCKKQYVASESDLQFFESEKFLKLFASINRDPLLHPISPEYLSEFKVFDFVPSQVVPEGELGLSIYVRIFTMTKE